VTNVAAEIIYAFSPTTPAGTAEATPYSTNLTMPALEVVTIEWKVPPGPCGHLGWALGLAGEVVIPQGAGTWIVTDDESGSWTLDEQPNSGSWYFEAYNTGIYNHTVYFRFLLNPLAPATPPSEGPTVLEPILPSTQTDGAVVNVLLPAEVES